MNINYWDEELAEKLAAVRKEVAGLNKDAPSLPAINKIAASIAQIKENSRKFFVFELRAMQSGDEKRVFQAKLDAYDKQIADAEMELKWARTAASKTELFDGRKAGPTDVNADDMLAEAHQIQAKTTESLKRTATRAREARDIGGEILKTMDEQTEQIVRIDEGVQGIDSELTRADEILKSIARRIMTDRIVLAILVLIVLAVIAVIIISAVDQDNAYVRPPEVLAPPQITRPPTGASG